MLAMESCSNSNARPVPMADEQTLAALASQRQAVDASATPRVAEKTAKPATAPRG